MDFSALSHTFHFDFDALTLVNNVLKLILFYYGTRDLIAARSIEDTNTALLIQIRGILYFIFAYT